MLFHKIEAILESAKKLEEAGCFGIVLELMPAESAKYITENLKIPTIGIGAGVNCSGQVVVIELCNKEGVDIVFAPSADEMYGEGQRLSNDTLTYVCPPFFYVNTLCGKSRTGHFDGYNLYIFSTKSSSSFFEEDLSSFSFKITLLL